VRKAYESYGWMKTKSMKISSMLIITILMIIHKAKQKAKEEEKRRVRPMAASVN